MAWSLCVSACQQDISCVTGCDELFGAYTTCLKNGCGAAASCL
jgi:hypothetical protein